MLSVFLQNKYIHYLHQDTSLNEKIELLEDKIKNLEKIMEMSK
ncbi:hypothetical protein V9L05_11230 [Bernardetia sp. Wsw4-3y2]